MYLLEQVMGRELLTSYQQAVNAYRSSLPCRYTFDPFAPQMFLWHTGTASSLLTVRHSLYILQFSTHLIRFHLLYRHLRNCKLPLEENSSIWMVAASQTPSLRILLPLTLLSPPCLLRTTQRTFDPPTSVVSNLVRPVFFLRGAKLYDDSPLCLSPGTNMYGSTNFLPTRFVLIGSRSRGSWIGTGVASTCVFRLPT